MRIEDKPDYESRIWHSNSMYFMIKVYIAQTQAFSYLSFLKKFSYRLSSLECTESHTVPNIREKQKTYSNLL